MHGCMCACMCACREYMIYYWYTISCISHVLYTNELSIYISTYVTQWYGMYFTYIHVQRSTHISYIFKYMVHESPPGVDTNLAHANTHAKLEWSKCPNFGGSWVKLRQKLCPTKLWIYHGIVYRDPHITHGTGYIPNIYRWLTDFCGKCR